MPANKLHIVSFDVPYPADYGGAIDIFYKVKSLHRAGCEVYLHCYEYGRGQAKELEQYCKAVYYYKRTTGIRGLSLAMPYIISSRRDGALLQRLQEVDAPILFEGVHTTYFISHPTLQSRYKVVRTHNIEHEYYLHLAGKETSFLKRAYFKAEAGLLKKYEGKLQAADAFVSLSLTDTGYFTKLYPDKVCRFIPPFHPYDAVESALGSGSYYLYHGNLSHPENRQAALYLLREVVPNTTAKFIIAGKDPGADLLAACHGLRNCELVANPDKTAMDALVEQAHIHVLPTFQQTGMKLKLLTALYGGRHVAVNKGMLHGTGLENACHVANDSDALVSLIDELMHVPFSAIDITQRTAMLAPYDKAGNAQQLLQIMSGK